MNYTKRYLAGIAGALLVCVLVVGPASAYDADTACASLLDVIAGGGSDITALELVIIDLDGSYNTQKLWTESIIDPEVSLAAKLRNTIEDEEQVRDISRIILTLVSGEERVSYKLSPGTSVFVELAEPVPFPEFPDNVPEETKRMLFIMKNLRNITESNTESTGFLDALKQRSRIADLFGTTAVKSAHSGLLPGQTPGSRIEAISTKDAELSRIGIVTAPDSANVIGYSMGSRDQGGRLLQFIQGTTSTVGSDAVAGGVGVSSTRSEIIAQAGGGDENP